MNIFVVLTWLMFIGLFPISFFWLRRAWIIWKKKDYSYVALKKGLPPKDPKKYAIYSLIINLAAGLIFAIVIILIVAVGMEYNDWTAIAGVTLWMKFLAEFILSRKAHMHAKK